ncbi:MAG: hypothetical protein MI717_10745 [Spirochaetales bacterium]|nr:hypothetical protein [Spirochaetales bacterium]
MRVRTFIGIEPIGRFTADHLSVPNPPGATGRVTWNASYHISPGLEVFWIITPQVEVGAGFRYELQRRVFHDSVDDAMFQFIPLYAAVRYRFLDTEKADLFLEGKAGYAFFQPSKAFLSIWDSEGGALQSTSGGLYASAIIGTVFPFLERPKWALEASLDVGYAYHMARGKNSVREYPMNYHAMTADFSLDFRF